MEAPAGSRRQVAAAPDSWLDWLITRIRAAPGPSWAAYLALFGALVVLGHAAFWLGGAVEPGVPDPLIFVQASFPILSLAWVQAIDALALRSLTTLRPAMPAGEAEVAGVAADLVRTPRTWALVAGVAGVAFGVTSVFASPGVYGLGEGAGPAAWAWALVVPTAADALLAAAVAHGLHQVGVVMRVHRDLVRVDLFCLDPLYGFANLTAVMGISSLVGVAYGLGSLTLVGVQFSLLELAWFAAFIPVAVAAFIVPLLGLHGRIQVEKARRHAEAGTALDAAVAEVHRRIVAGTFDGMSQLNDGLAAATSAYGTISKVSTWPWRPETLRGFISALALPIVIWIITALLSRVI